MSGGPIRASCQRAEAALNKRLLDEYALVQGVLDTGGRPYTVFLSLSSESDSRAHVMVVCSDFDGAPDRAPGVVHLARDVDTVWFGASKYGSRGIVKATPARVDADDVGNTVLIVKGRQCTCVSSCVVQFTLQKGESVVKHVSAVGNSASTYGWIETTRGVYVVQGFNCVTEGGAYFLPWSKVAGMEGNPSTGTSKWKMMMKLKVHGSPSTRNLDSRKFDCVS